MPGDNCVTDADWDSIVKVKKKKKKKKRSSCLK